MKNLKTIIVALILITTVKGVSANNFNKSGKNKKAEPSIEKVIKDIDLEEIKEAEINIEAWMISPANWRVNKNTETVDVEQEISLESWMTNPSEWGLTGEEKIEEEEIKIEDWMFKF